MDPDEVLRLARIANEKSLTTNDIDLCVELAEEALERYAALDEWISKGGFLPAAWARPTT